jgi:hypothetical protein
VSPALSANAGKAHRRTNGKIAPLAGAVIVTTGAWLQDLIELLDSVVEKPPT